MKKTNKIFVYAICILLSALIASATLMAGATDTVASEETTASTLPSISSVTTTTKEIDKVVEDFINDKELDDDLSEMGDDIRDFSGGASTFLSNLIEVFEDIRNALVMFINQIFNFDFLK